MMGQKRTKKIGQTLQIIGLPVSRLRQNEKDGVNNRHILHGNDKSDGTG